MPATRSRTGRSLRLGAGVEERESARAAREEALHHLEDLTPIEAGDIPMTPRAVEVLTHAERAARRFGSERVAPEHILLGLLEVGEGFIALEELGAPIEDLRQAAEQSIRA